MLTALRIEDGTRESRLIDVGDDDELVQCDTMTMTLPGEILHESPPNEFTMNSF
jgi:hypothetical protein